MTVKIIISGLMLIGLTTPVLAQTGNDTEASKKAYIDTAFGRMDENSDGKIERAEFTRFMENRMAQQKARFEAEFNESDKNNDGKLDKNEVASNPILAQRFDSIDSNKDAHITPEEIRAAILAAQADQLPQE